MIKDFFINPHLTKNRGEAERFREGQNEIIDNRAGSREDFEQTIGGRQRTYYFSTFPVFQLHKTKSNSSKSILFFS